MGKVARYKYQSLHVIIGVIREGVHIAQIAQIFISRIVFVWLHVASIHIWKVITDQVIL